MATATVKAFDALESSLEQIRDTDAHEVATVSPGECWWQGDVGVQYLGAERPKLDLEPVPNPVAQLAPGTTQGSRHMLANLAKCRVFRLKQSHALTGYVIEAPHGVVVEHPEHGDVTVREAGWYAIRFQRQFAEELKRAQD